MHVSEQIAEILIDSGFDFNNGEYRKMFQNVVEAGQLSDGRRVMILRLDETGRWFESVDGFGKVLKDIDLRNWSNDPYGAIRKMVN